MLDFGVVLGYTIFKVRETDMINFIQGNNPGDMTGMYLVQIDDGFGSFRYMISYWDGYDFTDLGYSDMAVGFAPLP